ncbi:MAG: hypothetical protein O2840_03940 [bacterium]|nr:hypothetical protein [bacterium]
MDQKEAYSSLLNYVLFPPAESRDLSGLRAVALLGMLDNDQLRQISSIVGTKIE